MGWSSSCRRRGDPLVRVLDRRAPQLVPRPRPAQEPPPRPGPRCPTGSPLLERHERISVPLPDRLVRSSRIANRGDYDPQRARGAVGHEAQWIGHEGAHVLYGVICEAAAPTERRSRSSSMPTTRREVAGDTRTVLRLHPRLAPVKVAVLPLIGRTEGMTGKARPLYEELRRDGSAEYDDSASIGKRYRRQDEIGTPWAHNRLPDARDDTITIRPRLPRRRNAFRSRTRALPREQLLAPWTPRGQR